MTTYFGSKVVNYVPIRICQEEVAGAMQVSTSSTVPIAHPTTMVISIVSVSMNTKLRRGRRKEGGMSETNREKRGQHCVLYESSTVAVACKTTTTHTSGHVVSPRKFVRNVSLTKHVLLASSVSF